MMRDYQCGEIFNIIVIVSSQRFAEPAIPQCVYFIFSITLGAQKYFEVREQIRV